MVTNKHRIDNLIICVIVSFDFVPPFKTSEQSQTKITKDLPASCFEDNKPVDILFSE